MALLSPWTDLTNRGASVQSKAAVDPMLSPEVLEICAEQYVGKKERAEPLASPLFADLTDGLPPTMIQVGSDEVLLDDSRRFAERARAAGVEIELEEWPGMMHVFQFSARILPEGRRAIERIGRFIVLRCLGRSSSSQ